MCPVFKECGKILGYCGMCLFQGYANLYYTVHNAFNKQQSQKNCSYQTQPPLSSFHLLYPKHVVKFDSNLL